MFETKCMVVSRLIAFSPSVSICGWVKERLFLLVNDFWGTSNISTSDSNNFCETKSTIQSSQAPLNLSDFKYMEKYNGD